MINVETDNPVYSNADGKAFKKLKDMLPKGKTDAQKATAKGERAIKKGERDVKQSGRKADREVKKADRKAKRAKKNGSPLTKLKEKFLKKIKEIKTNREGKKVKTQPDGTETVVAPKNIVVTPQGEYDKVEIGRALNVPPEQVTSALIAQRSVATAPTTTAIASATIIPASPSADLAIVVQPSLVENDSAGMPYLSVDLQSVDEPLMDVAKEESGKRKLSKTEKIVLWAGVGLVVIIVGYLGYKKFTSKKK